MARVAIENVSKQFTRAGHEHFMALSGVNLEVRDHELMVLVGPSGSGKSTLLRLIAGLDLVTAGSIRIGDRVANQLGPRERDVAMVFQQDALYPHLTVAGNLGLGLRLRGCRSGEIQDRVRQTAASLGLTSLLESRPAELSGGERQRVALGRALVRNPQVLLLDEPLSHLDPQWRVRIQEQLQQLHAALGMTILYVTHDQGEAMALGQRLAVLRDGQMQQIADPRSIYDAPANLFVARFVGSPGMNLFRGRVGSEEQHLIFVQDGAGECGMRYLIPSVHAGKVRPYAGREILLGIRPENFRFCGETDASNRLGRPVRAVLRRIIPTGGVTHYVLDAGTTELVMAGRLDADVQIGQIVLLQPDGARLHFFDPVTEQRLG